MKNVDATIITIGDELLIGQTIDTNSAFIAQELNKIGVWVKRRIAIGDVKEEILATLTEQSKDNDIIIITGGLGPTADDITKPALCEYFRAKLIVNEDALQNVKDIFTKLNRPLIERNLKQAEVPDNCVVLPNRRGTAPGMWFETDSPSRPSRREGHQPHNTSPNENPAFINEIHKSEVSSVDSSPVGGSRMGAVVYISLPGVPHEMKGLMLHSVIPKLKETFELPAVVHRTLLTSGIGESMLAEAIADFENNLPSHIKLAYLPAYGMVRLRLTGRAANRQQVEKEVADLFSLLKLLVKEWMVADEDIPLEAAVNKLLREKNKTLATAESCTGGYIAHLITSIAGSSDVFKGSVVSYDNEVKENLLGVKNQTLKAFGAVSEQTVIEMAQGALAQLKTDYVIATSGIMGPGGGSEEKPVGTVWIAVGKKNNIKASRHFFRFDRERNIDLTAHTALTLLYRFINKEE